MSLGVPSTNARQASHSFRCLATASAAGPVSLPMAKAASSGGGRVGRFGRRHWAGSRKDRASGVPYLKRASPLILSEKPRRGQKKFGIRRSGARRLGIVKTCRAGEYRIWFCLSAVFLFWSCPAHGRWPSTPESSPPPIMVSDDPDDQLRRRSARSCQVLAALARGRPGSDGAAHRAWTSAATSGCVGDAQLEFCLFE